MNSLILSNVRMFARNFKTLSHLRINQQRLMVQASNRLTYLNYQRFSTAPLSDSEVIELVEGKVFEVLKSAAKCNHAKLSRTATFEELGFDSLDNVELVLAMEEHFGFDLSNQDAEKITTVMDAIQIFHTYQVKRSQPATQQQ
ncbi:nadh dehydrogenase 1 alpha beta subcomplex 1 [Stylonychia lemnae]|uniref:Acyl carrier protein n=1 Tax=Stylonychia lemnae TaxID=5949 RepID=A0A078AMF2_STYLE|nr:nadh dehydrogenase 1 alpha beta subcomplex 1 [Stylonychia lemnae]|eukprot:CDW83354.1 nadh dehydrogenase 1 alpha beta subcomplex 1 [Stylonychia lemnae]